MFYIEYGKPDAEKRGRRMMDSVSLERNDVEKRNHLSRQYLIVLTDYWPIGLHRSLDMQVVILELSDSESRPFYVRVLT